VTAGTRTVELSDILAEMDRRGMSDADQRRQLRRLGFHATYRAGHQSLREMARRARQRGLCAGGCGRQGVTNAAQTCDACLEQRWSKQ
jgi:hypothetical protein